MKSIFYYLLLLAIKAKGLKKKFSRNPINYQELRKEDIHSPKKKFFAPNQIRSFKILSSTVTEISSKEKNQKLLIFCHGGAFVSGPVKHHWESAKKIVQKTNATVWMVDYPKAPENKIDEISANIDAVYSKALLLYDPVNIFLFGDSVGGTLVIALTQRLVQKKLPLPAKLILVSAVLDASLSNPEIKIYEEKDPMLSTEGVLSAKKMCSVNGDLRDPCISPLNGNFKNFPSTMVFMAENDITFPDQKLMVEKLKQEHTELEIILGKGMPHIWPILPVIKEGKAAFKTILEFIKQ